MEGKKLYTLLVYSENIAGILNQITAVFTRRQVNIESLNVSASSIQGSASVVPLFSSLECETITPSEEATQ